MKTPTVAGIVLLTLAIGTALLLGTLGWLVVGFGTMTDCTNDYSCSSTGCPPCATAGRWINAGGIIQWVIAGGAVAILVRGLRAGRPSHLLIGGATLLSMSVLTVVATT